MGITSLMLTPVTQLVCVEPLKEDRTDWSQEEAKACAGACGASADITVNMSVLFSVTPKCSHKKQKRR